MLSRYSLPVFIIMSGTVELRSIDAEGPEYYAELLCMIPRRANRLPSDGQSYPDVPGMQDIDFALTRRLQTLLDAVANISLCQRGNVSATMASLKDSTGTLETQLYIVFNHQNDKSALDCPQHLQNIINMLRQVPYESSPKVISIELLSNHIEIYQAIHDYSFEVFHYRVTKHGHKLSEIRGYIEEDRRCFTNQQRGMLLEFLNHVDMIITTTTAMTTTRRQVPTSFIKGLLAMYSYWTNNNLLPNDTPADNKLTLLDRADTWLTESA